MDAEIEVVDGVIEPAGGESEQTELVQSGRASLSQRARSVAANPRIQGAAAATAGMAVGAATMALMRRAGGTGMAARGAGRLSPGPVGPSRVAWPAGPTIGPIAPGTYVVRVRAIGVPPQQQSQ